jgi:glycosyltransferase involved in cell wall biosynthesis
MKILFIAAQLYLPQSYGGVQSSTDQLCRALIARGHEVALLMSLTTKGVLGFRSRLHLEVNRRLAGCKVACDRTLGYRTWRTWFPEDAVEYVARKERPDLIVIMSGWKILPAALEAKRTGHPLLIQLHDVAFGQDYGDQLDPFIGRTPFVSNSQFTAERYLRQHGISSTVIYPYTRTDKYITQTTREKVTFINPLPPKGVDIATAVARRCPEIPFSFVEGWALSKAQRQTLNQALSDLPNVTLLPSQRDMRKIYERCRILLVPSVVYETFGRVVTEAQASGIPVIASCRGGLPENVGAGGILIDPDEPITAWVSAVRSLWQGQRYNELSAAARIHSQRRELSPSYQTEAWEQAFMAAAMRH